MVTPVLNGVCETGTHGQVKRKTGEVKKKHSNSVEFIVSTILQDKENTHTYLFLASFTLLLSSFNNLFSME